jgi:hypothetical protein
MPEDIARLLRLAVLMEEPQTRELPKMWAQLFDV